MRIIETEFKNIINNKQFQNIKTKINFDKSIRQTNFYYDTKQYSLQKKRIGLRIRVFYNNAEETIKIPSSNNLSYLNKHELTEITVDLDKQNAMNLIKANKIFKEKKINTILKQNNINIDNLKIIAYATTKRFIKYLSFGSLVLDKTYYPNKKYDYELELEFNNDKFNIAKSFFNNLLNKFNISKNISENKMKRAIKNSNNHIINIF